MSWYSEERDGETKKYLEWCYNIDLEPDDEAGYYRIKRKRRIRAVEGIRFQRRTESPPTREL